MLEVLTGLVDDVPGEGAAGDCGILVSSVFEFDCELGRADFLVSRYL